MGHGGVSGGSVRGSDAQAVHVRVRVRVRDLPSNVADRTFPFFLLWGVEVVVRRFRLAHIRTFLCPVLDHNIMGIVNDTSVPDVRLVAHR